MSRVRVVNGIAFNWFSPQVFPLVRVGLGAVLTALYCGVYPVSRGCCLTGAVFGGGVVERVGGWTRAAVIGGVVGMVDRAHVEASLVGEVVCLPSRTVAI